MVYFLSGAPIETVHTRGYRFIALLRTPDGPRTVLHQRPAASLPVLPLPARVSALIGRERELGELKTAFSKTRLITLVGPGGVGRTQLGLELARQLADDFADGVCFVDLAPYSDATAVSDRVAALLDTDGDVADAHTVDRVAHRLRDRRLLLLLDNCEHVVLGCAALARAVLNTCAEISILATSQCPLGVAGESIAAVHPLQVPLQVPADTMAGPDDDAALGDVASVRLFVSRAVAVQPAFSLNASATTRRAVADICRRLDGMPLAVEMAAARLNVLAPEQIAARLEDRFALLTEGRTTFARHQTLRAAMDWSYRLLPDPERILLERVSVFAGGWSFDAMERVCSDDELPPAGLLDAVAGLVDRSFVIAEPYGDGYRYRLHETVRAYAKSFLDRSGSGTTLRARHFAYFLRMVRDADRELLGVHQSQWLARLDLEHANLTAAYEWALSSPERDADAIGFAVALRWYWRCRSRFVEARTWLTRAIDAAPTD